eukprot:SAG11_NODE_4133_length_2046_cov_6.321007_1_plen_206_part_00
MLAPRSPSAAAAVQSSLAMAIDDAIKLRAAGRVEFFGHGAQKIGQPMRVRRNSVSSELSELSDGLSELSDVFTMDEPDMKSVTARSASSNVSGPPKYGQITDIGPPLEVPSATLALAQMSPRSVKWAHSVVVVQQNINGSLGTAQEVTLKDFDGEPSAAAARYGSIHDGPAVMLLDAMIDTFDFLRSAFDDSARGDDYQLARDFF